MSEKNNNHQAIISTYTSGGKTYRLTEEDLTRKKPTEPVASKKELSSACIGCGGLMTLFCSMEYRCHVCEGVNPDLSILTYKGHKCGFEPEIFSHTC